MSRGSHKDVLPDLNLIQRLISNAKMTYWISIFCWLVRAMDRLHHRCLQSSNSNHPQDVWPRATSSMQIDGAPSWQSRVNLRIDDDDCRYFSRCFLIRSISTEELIVFLGWISTLNCSFDARCRWRDETEERFLTSKAYDEVRTFYHFSTLSLSPSLCLCLLLCSSRHRRRLPCCSLVFVVIITDK